MAVPRNRTSHARKHARRSHHAKKPKRFNVCSHCDTYRPSHCVCPSCGRYNDRVVLQKGEQE